VSEKKARGPEWVRKTPQYKAVADQVAKANEASKSAKEVTDEESCAAAAELLSKVAKVVKYGDKNRLDVGEPYRKSQTAINEEFKELTSPLVGVEARLREEVETFETQRREREEEAQRKHAEDVRKAEAAQKKAEEDAAKAAAEAEAANQPPPEPPPPSPPPPPPPPPREQTTRATSTGSVGVRTEWKYEVIDFSLVPDSLKSLNQAEATRLVRGGERSIPGLRIYSVDKAHVR